MTASSHVFLHEPVSPSHQALQQAAEWFALLRSEEASEASHRQWQAWVQESEENSLAWQYVERISSQFAPLQASNVRHAAAGAYCKANTRLARRKVLTGLTALTGVALLGWSAWKLPFLSSAFLDLRADYSSAVGEVREVFLKDGTHIWLSTASGFNENYNENSRDLVLLAGEILIETAPDALRPFIVHTPHGKLQALGTRFSVRMDTSDTTCVAVFEGAVEVRIAGTGKSTVINSGRQTHFTSTALGKNHHADPGREAWAQGILMVDNLPLSQVIEELSRYRNGHITVDPEVASLPVFGSYPITNLDQTLRMLASVMPIHIKQTMPWWIVIEPSDKKK